jgi:6-phosphogluconolactonase (cycloisomerase 2 family)
VYVADIDSDKVSRYAVLSNGKLGDAESVPTGAAHPRGVAVSPDGRFLYVSHGTPMPPPAEPGFLTTMDIRPDGTLSPGDNQIRIGFSGAMIAIPPDGRFLYVGAQASDEVYGFRIGPDGGLTAVPGPTPTAKSAGVPEGIAVTPDGHHVYTADEDDALGNVRGFTAAADGSLTDVRRKPFDRHHSHVGIAVTPDGRYVYASNGTDNRVTGFAIDGAGILHRVADSPSYGVGSAFQSLAISPGLG